MPTQGVTLRAQGLGHRFASGWLFQQINLTLPQGAQLAITGANGSGKSTLLRILAGQLTPETGSLSWHQAGRELEPSNWYQHLSWASPALELYPALTVTDTVGLYYRFKSNRLITLSAWLDAVALQGKASARVGELSSGQKQRLLWGLAFYADTPALLLDEPTANLDAHWRGLVIEALQSGTEGRTVVIASNQPAEYEHIAERLNLA